jgi:hypothetical protein
MSRRSSHRVDLLGRIAVAAVIVIGATTFLAGCAGDPEPLPFAIPAPPAAPPIALPSPAPEPLPPELPAEPLPSPEEPAPLGHAPLVETRWELVRLYGDMRRLVPPSRDIWIELRPSTSHDPDDTSGSGPIHVQGPQNTIEGTYAYRINTASPRESLTFEEGTLTGDSIVRNRRAGSFHEFEDMLLDNLGLLKGYYISGETPEESILTIWGGYRSEEVILMELRAVFPQGLPAGTMPP